MSPNYADAVSNYFTTRGPDYEAAKGAQDAYFAALRAHGSDVVVLPPLEGFPDCSFTEDTAVILDDCAVIPNLGHPSRDGEQDSVAEFLADDFEIHRMPAGATLDGGDVIFFDNRFLVGRSTRTNDAAVSFFEQIVGEKGYDVMVFDIPASTLHLTTVCSSPKPGVLVAAEGHLTPEQFAPLVEDGVEILWVPNEESYAANVIGFENKSKEIIPLYSATTSIVSSFMT